MSRVRLADNANVTAHANAAQTWKNAREGRKLMRHPNHSSRMSCCEGCRGHLLTWCLHDGAAAILFETRRRINLSDESTEAA